MDLGIFFHGTNVGAGSPKAPPPPLPSHFKILLGRGGGKLKLLKVEGISLPPFTV